MLPTCASHSFLPGPQVWPSQIEPQSPGLLERAAITHYCAGCAANDRPIVVSAEMHAINQRASKAATRALDVSLDAGPRCTDFACTDYGFAWGRGRELFSDTFSSPREGQLPDRFRLWTG